jgi:putative ABC transport system permease protein
LHLRTSQEPASVAAAVRSVVHELDAELPVFAVTTLEDHVSGSYFQQQMMGTLLAAFGVLALVLAAVGIYGVLAYSVSQRTHEIGLRMALGAGRGDILKMVLRQGTLVAGLGIFVGCVAAAGSTRLLRKMLFGVDALDPLSFGAAALALAAVALFACYLPARRATTVDPMIALRYE